MKMLGDSLATGKHRFYGGLDNEDMFEEQEELNIDDNEEFYPEQFSQYTSSTPSVKQVSTAFTSRQPSPRSSSASISTKRRASDLFETSTKKKGKISGSNALDSIGRGMEMIAQSFNKEIEVQKEQVDTTLAGQATIQIQEEICLTDDGKLVMIDLLDDEKRVRKYMAMASNNSLREKWLKKELMMFLKEENNKEQLSSLFLFV